MHNRKRSYQEDNMPQFPTHAPVLWFTGLSGAGKTTIAREIHQELTNRGIKVELLDGDEIRAVLSPDLGFSRKDRDLQVQRLGYIASLLARNRVVVLVSAISPYESSRNQALSMCERGREIHVHAPFETVLQRDTKGLYKKALAGEIKGLTGYDDPYEAPTQPDLFVPTAELELDQAKELVMRFLEKELADAGI